MSSSLCVPTFNAGKDFPLLLASIRRQSRQADELLVIDSSSSDDTAAIARNAGVRVEIIRSSEFNHGGTRQLGVAMMPDSDIIIFLTQDAILANPDAVEKLLACFDDESVGASYGRQLPRLGADPIEAHARIFNYPPVSRIKSINDAARLGLKTAFISNSFAAYRRSALAAVGGFPSNTICTEDTFVAARMLIAGWKVAYCAEAKVYHSHNYALLEEFRRYFDIGVFYGRENWIGKAFGNAEGEGMRFIRSEITFLLRESIVLVPSAVIRTLLKFIGYKLGFMEKRLPDWLKIKLSMNKGFWRKY